MVEDQRFASSRTDVLIYQTEPLERDVTIAGPLTRHRCTSRPPAPIPIGS